MTDRSGFSFEAIGWFRWLLVVVVVSGLSGCVLEGFVWPDATSAEWQRFESQKMGFSVLYPEVCAVEEVAGSVRFLHQGDPIFVVNWASEEEGRRRGLWFDHEPVEQTEVDGRAAEKFVYVHFDGPAGVRSVSYVVPHRDRFLGLELRIAGDPDESQRKIVDSLRLKPTGAQYAQTHLWPTAGTAVP